MSTSAICSHFNTWPKVSHIATDSLCVITGPLGVSNSSPCSRQVDFHSTFPLVRTSHQTNVSIAMLRLYKKEDFLSRNSNLAAERYSRKNANTMALKRMLLQIDLPVTVTGTSALANEKH